MSEVVWIVEYLSDDAQIISAPITGQNYTIGRHSNCDLQVSYEGVSRQHAELSVDGDRLSIRDLGSSNGTYVNRVKIDDVTELSDKDIFHISNKEFRVISKPFVTRQAPDNDCTVMYSPELETSLVSSIQHLQDLISNRVVTSFFQPIVTAESHQRYAYEALGRGRHASLPVSPGSLFEIAEQTGKAVELSTLFRSTASHIYANSGEEHFLFVNAHPLESDVSVLVGDFERLQKIYPGIRFVLEINEQAVTDLDSMRSLRERLKLINVGLAYDDFGAGQGRLAELMDVPPDFLKFDINLVRDIHKQSEQARYVVKTLVDMAKELGIVTLAEGIECKESADVCTSLGFDLIQGYYFGRPAEFSR